MRLSLSILRADLSRVVSKYVGDTEKNLTPVFDRVKKSGAILFFDEADALFAKRTEVHDSHDRYANLEIAHLLQQIESHDGLVILAINQLTQPDNAFADERWCRLLRRTVRFPLPRR
jgi:SpoVK/Ycf46/Vps4 family AAA+-type ATPase